MVGLNLALDKPMAMGTKVNLGFMFVVGVEVSVTKVKQTTTNLSSYLR